MLCWKVYLQDTKYAWDYCWESMRWYNPLNHEDISVENILGIGKFDLYSKLNDERN